MSMSLDFSKRHDPLVGMSKRTGEPAGTGPGTGTRWNRSGRDLYYSFVLIWNRDPDLDGLPNVPSSRYRNSDVHDANIEDGNLANWIGKDFDDHDYGEDSEEDYIEETPAWNVIPSDESNQEEEPQEQQPSKKRKFATPQKRRQPKKPTQTKKPPPPQKRTQEKYPTKPKPKNKKRLKKS
ncbi:unnamed protein product [Lactuca saligna]|uniref:Uncharacterized protein n=1 Tax=Lactuca saligna TaxID=75948 RepID=A0AA35UKP4_LACSI|nr:unnamed protein product [Lactuca saligna]